MIKRNVIFSKNPRNVPLNTAIEVLTSPPKVFAKAPEHFRSKSVNHKELIFFQKQVPQNVHLDTAIAVLTSPREIFVQRRPKVFRSKSKPKVFVIFSEKC